MKKLLLFLCTALVAFASNAAEVFEIGNLEYEIMTNTSFNAVKVRGVSAAGKTATSITIPSNVTYSGSKYRVYEIRENAFATNNKLTSVYILFGVQTIGSKAFQGCTELKTVKLGSSVATIGSYAFDGCSKLESMYHVGFSPITDIYANSIPSNSGMTLYISNSTRALASNFSSKTGWSKFATIKNERACYDFYSGTHNYAVGVPDSNGPTATRNAYLVSVDDDVATVYPASSITDNGMTFQIYGIAQGACRNKTSITSVNLSNATNLRIIETSAFSGCTSLSSITLVEGLTHIKNYAFKNTAITSLTIPASVYYFEDYYFVDDCPNLTNISVASGNASFTAHNGALTSKDKKTLYRVPEGKTSYDMSDFTEIIYNYAFYQCKVTGITCYYGVKTINSNAFSGCDKLIQVRIPSSVTTLGNYVFTGCTSLSRLLVNLSTPPSITADNMFNGVDRSKIILHTPYDKKTAYENAGWTGFKAYNPDQDQAYDMALGGYTSTGNSVTTTRYYSVVSNSSVTRLGDNFDGRVKLVHNGTRDETSITVPDYIKWNGKKYVVDEIGQFAFYNFTSLKTVKLPPHLRYIDYEAFWNAPLEGTLALPYGLYSISNYAFENTKLTRLVVPSSVSSISTSAFASMSSLTELVLNGGISDLTNSSYTWSISSFPSTCRILVPTGKVQQFKNHDSWKSRSSYISAGAYDFVYTTADYPSGSSYSSNVYYLTITSTSSQTYDGTTYAGTAKYVYHPNVSNATSFGASLSETDHTCGLNRKYLITELGDSCLVWSKITSFTFPAQLKKIGAYCFQSSKIAGTLTIPSTVTSIGKHAFLYCSDLTGLRFNHSTPPFSEQIFANNASNFECIVLRTTFHTYYNMIKNWSRNGGSKDPYKTLAAWFKPSNATGTLGLPIAVSFSKSNIPESYIATYYDKNANELTMQLVNQVPENTGVLMAGLNTSTEYILHQPDGSVSAPSMNYLVATGASTVDLANINVAFAWNFSNYFSKSTSTLDPGFAYLKLTSTQAGSNTKVYTDLFGQPSKPGDVNGDGDVTGEDLNMLINILLNKITANDPSVLGNPNVNGEGGVDGNDLNALINILLGK